MSELECKKNGKRGRQPKYTTKDLMEYIDYYVKNTEVVGQIDASKLARYVKSTFNIEFDYRYFNRNIEVKQYIAKLNHIYNYERDKVGKEIALVFNPDKLVDTYRNDSAMLKHHLRGFESRYEEMSERVKEYKDQCLMNKHDIKRMQESIEELRKQNTDLRLQNKKLKNNVSVLKKFKKFDESIQMLKYLEGKNIITDTNIETFKAVLSHCKLIESEDIPINNEKDILNVNDTCENDIQSDNIINIKDISTIKNDDNIIKTHMERMRERLKKD